MTHKQAFFGEGAQLGRGCCVGERDELLVFLDAEDAVLAQEGLRCGKSFALPCVGACVDLALLSAQAAGFSRGIKEGFVGAEGDPSDAKAHGVAVPFGFYLGRDILAIAELGAEGAEPFDADCVASGDTVAHGVDEQADHSFDFGGGEGRATRDLLCQIPKVCRALDEDARGMKPLPTPEGLRQLSHDVLCHTLCFRR